MECNLKGVYEDKNTFDKHTFIFLWLFYLKEIKKENINDLYINYDLVT
jgi:hypothetical protein